MSSGSSGMQHDPSSPQQLASPCCSTDMYGDQGCTDPACTPLDVHQLRGDSVAYSSQRFGCSIDIELTYLFIVRYRLTIVRII